MSGANNSHRAGQDRLTAFLVDDILTMTDAELAAEANESGIDIAAAGKHGRDLLGKARASIAQQRLAAARRAVAVDRQDAAKVVSLDPARARRGLDSFLKRHPDMAGTLTLAARHGKNRSDEDVVSMVEDLVDLGVDIDDIVGETE